MATAYLAALISSFTMAAVYLTDMAMAGRTYSRPSQPMLVSSVFSAIPAIVLLLLVERSSLLPATACWMAFFAGVVLMLANLLYFIVVYSDAGECTEIACFESSSVLVIVLVTFGMGFAGIRLHDSIADQQWLGVVVGALGLLAVHAYGDKMEYVSWNHRWMLVGFMLFGACYEMLIDRAIYLASVPLAGIEENPKQAAYLQISPFFWLGLATGVVAILPRKEQVAWEENLNNLKKYWWAVALVEGLAIIAFGAAVFGFAEGHVAVIAFLAGTFAVAVLIGGVVLRRWFGFSEESFPVIQHPFKKFAAVFLVIAGAVLASWNS